MGFKCASGGTLELKFVMGYQNDNLWPISIAGDARLSTPMAHICVTNLFLLDSKRLNVSGNLELIRQSKDVTIPELLSGIERLYKQSGKSTSMYNRSVGSKCKRLSFNVSTITSWWLKGLVGFSWCVTQRVRRLYSDSQQTSENLALFNGDENFGIGEWRFLQLMERIILILRC